MNASRGWDGNFLFRMSSFRNLPKRQSSGSGRCGPGPDITSEPFDAFLFVINVWLPALCIDLEVAVAGHLLPQLYILHDTIRRPALLLDTLHALEPHHHALLHHNSDSRPSSALNTASTTYVALRARLCDELPVYLNLLHRGVTLCVSQLAKWQARLWRDI